MNCDRTITVFNHLVASLGYKLSLGSSANDLIVIRYIKGIN